MEQMKFFCQVYNVLSYPKVAFIVFFINKVFIPHWILAGWSFVVAKEIPYNDYFTLQEKWNDEKEFFHIWWNILSYIHTWMILITENKIVCVQFPLQICVCETTKEVLGY